MTSTVSTWPARQTWLMKSAVPSSSSIQSRKISRFSSAMLRWIFFDPCLRCGDGTALCRLHHQERRAVLALDPLEHLAIVEDGILHRLLVEGATDEAVLLHQLGRVGDDHAVGAALDTRVDQGRLECQQRLALAGGTEQLGEFIHNADRGLAGVLGLLRSALLTDQQLVAAGLDRVGLGAGLVAG